MPHGDRSIAVELWRGLRDGTAGFAARVGLSLAGAAAGLGALMVILGLAEASAQRVEDWHVAAGVLVVVTFWLGLLYLIWATYSRWQLIVRTVFVSIGIAGFSICAAVFFASAFRRGEEFLVAASLFFGLAGVGLTITGALQRGLRGRALLGPAGQVEVGCPRCGYSMAGLDSSSCPECGARYTLDELIRAQNYEALRAGALPPSRGRRGALLASPSFDASPLPSPAPSGEADPAPLPPGGTLSANC